MYRLASVRVSFDDPPEVFEVETEFSEPKKPNRFRNKKAMSQKRDHVANPRSDDRPLKEDSDLSTFVALMSARFLAQECGFTDDGSDLVNMRKDLVANGKTVSHQAAICAMNNYLK